MEQRPSPWDERTQPDFQISDLAQSGLSYRGSFYALQDIPEAWAYVNTLNNIRLPLHAQLRGRELPAVLRFYVPAIRQLVSDITATPRWPQHRIVMNGSLRHTPVWRTATAAGLTEPMTDSLPEHLPAITVVDPLLGVVRINDSEYQDLEPTRHPVEILDAVASTVGAAALASTIDVVKDANRYRYTTGVTWPGDGKVYGEMLQQAAVTKIAALVRKELNLAVQEPAAHPVLAPYQKWGKYTPGDVIAAGLDTINHAAGFRPDQPGIYTPLWEFAKTARNTQARDEVAAIIRAAAKEDTSFTLETLEGASSYSGLPVGLLHRLEEACGIDVHERVSAQFT